MGRTNLIIAQKIADSIKEAYSEMGLQQLDLISFFNFVEVMTKIGYAKDFNENEKLLLNGIWVNLIPHDKMDNNSE